MVVRVMQLNFIASRTAMLTILQSTWTVVAAASTAGKLSSASSKSRAKLSPRILIAFFNYRNWFGFYRFMEYIDV